MLGVGMHESGERISLLHKYLLVIHRNGFG